jgi:hypothetical protein
MLIFYCGQNTIQFNYPLKDSFSLSDKKDAYLLEKCCPVHLLEVHTSLLYSPYLLRGDGLNCTA